MISREKSGFGWARQVLDSELADRFRSKYESFIIGELVGKGVEGRK
jgi:hypothetical protein